MGRYGIQRHCMEQARQCKSIVMSTLGASTSGWLKILSVYFRVSPFWEPCIESNTPSLRPPVIKKIPVYAHAGPFWRHTSLEEASCILIVLMLSEYSVP